MISSKPVRRVLRKREVVIFLVLAGLIGWWWLHLSEQKKDAARGIPVQGSMRMVKLDEKRSVYDSVVTGPGVVTTAMTQFYYNKEAGLGIEILVNARNAPLPVVGETVKIFSDKLGKEWLCTERGDNCFPVRIRNLIAHYYAPAISEEK